MSACKVCGQDHGGQPFDHDGEAVRGRAETMAALEARGLLLSDTAPCTGAASCSASASAGAGPVEDPLRRPTSRAARADDSRRRTRRWATPRRSSAVLERGGNPRNGSGQTSPWPWPTTAQRPNRYQRAGRGATRLEGAAMNLRGKLRELLGLDLIARGVAEGFADARDAASPTATRRSSASRRASPSRRRRSCACSSRGSWKRRSRRPCRRSSRSGACSCAPSASGSPRPLASRATSSAPTRSTSARTAGSVTRA